MRYALLGSVLAVSVLLEGPVALRAEPPPAHPESPVARLVRGLTSRVWGGPRVPPPWAEARPALRPARVAPDGTLAVHAPAAASPERTEAAFAALTRARHAVRALGFGEPLPDGGRGGTLGFDLYLVEEPAGARGVSDGLDHTGTLDAAIAHAVVGIDADDLEACVVDAYAQAAFLGFDPAESERVRRAFSAWVTYAITGRAGCDDALLAWQLEPEAGPFDEALHRGAGGALFLELLDSRYGGGGVFVRDLAQLLRQRTWEGEGLRASPDVWEAIEAIAKSKGDRFDDLLAEISLARGLPPARSPHRALRALDAPPSMLWRGSPQRLPWHTRASDRGVAAGGAIYSKVELGEIEAGDALSVWLEGEYGARFSLAAVALDAEGRELARSASPPGGGATPHRAFVPLVVPEGKRELLLVGTGFGFERPDEDSAEPVARHARFVIARSEASRGGQ